MEKKVSESVVNSGIERISSKTLSQKMNVTASQIRQDLNCFGGFGQQGYGYNVKFLKDSIARILGLDRGYTAILVGAGHMGRTFAINTKFETRGFRLVGIFDTDPKKDGLEVGKHKVKPYSMVKDFIEENHPQMAILAVPKEAAPKVARELIGYGIKAFMNFSYTELSAVDEDIAIENVHLGDSLMRLSYKIVAKDTYAEEKNAD